MPQIRTRKQTGMMLTAGKKAIEEFKRLTKPKKPTKPKPPKNPRPDKTKPAPKIKNPRPDKRRPGGPGRPRRKKR